MNPAAASYKAGGGVGDFSGSIMTPGEKEERKRQRAERIEKRFANEAKEKGRAKGGSGSGDDTSRTRGQQQMADSLSHLDKKKVSGLEEVTAIRTEADFRENRRRIKDDALAQDRLQMLQEEAIQSGKRNAAIEMRWAELLELNMPQHLHQEIEAQKAACADIIASKDSLIREFKKQLKIKDEEYVKSLKRYEDDVEELLRRMRKEIKDLQSHYEVEMDAIETAFLMERDEMLKASHSEVESLVDRRRQKELIYMKEKQAREEGYQQEMEDLLVQEAEEYNKLKIKLETEIQTLEQQLEEMRATYQLNTEKLEYNYRVLTERDMENTATLAHQKKKLSKLKDSLNNLVQRFHDNEARDRRRNDELTEEYQRITKQYKDLQSKFRHFEISDHQRFEQVWAMHEEEIKAQVDKVLTADKILHQQLLGWDWKPPRLDLIYTNNPDPGNDPDDDEGNNNNHLNSQDGSSNERLVVDVVKVKRMLELLAGEAGFLLDNKVQEALQRMSPQDASMAQAESLLLALGVTDEAQLQALVNYFLKEVPAPFQQEGEEGGLSSPTSPHDEEDEDEEQMAESVRHLQIVIKPDDVIMAIQHFVQDRREGVIPTSATSSQPQQQQLQAQYTSAGAKTGGSRDTQSSDRPNNSGNKAKKSVLLAHHEKEFWARLAGVLPEQHYTAWRQLEKELERYNHVLRDRGRCLDNISRLQEENANLKQLLNVYLSSKVNEELLIGPTDTFRLQDDDNDNEHINKPTQIPIN